MRPKGSAQELEVRRRLAGRLLLQGKGIREVARLMGASPAAVHRWKRVVEREGLEGLKAKPHPGPRPRLTPEQKQRLKEILRQGPQAAGFPTDLWTLARVTQVIQRTFRVKYHPGHVWRLLRALNFTPQKPERRARERDEAAVERWRRQDWPRIKKKAREEGWSIVMLDETGFLLQPLVRRTWAPRGQTPVQYSWDRHDRLSVISAITLAPLRRRLGLYFQLHGHNIRFAEVLTFLRLVHRQVRRKFLLVLDRASPRRKAIRLLQQAGAAWLEVEWLPAYAPDLNPVEMIWNHTKYADLANYLPDDVHDLHRAVTSSIQAARSNGCLLRSAFEPAGLSL